MKPNMIIAAASSYYPGKAQITFYPNNGKTFVRRVDGPSYQRLATHLLTNRTWNVDPAVESCGWFAFRRGDVECTAEL